jgi:hypothetical protein
MLRELTMKGHMAGLLALAALLTVVGCSSASTPAAAPSPSAADSTASTGSKCAAAPTQLLTANDLFGLDASAVGISAGMDLAVNATDLYVAVNYGSSGGAILRGGHAESIVPCAPTWFEAAGA